MHLDTSSHSSTRSTRRADPLFDRVISGARIASDSRLADTRLLYVAAETGARFVRERINVDPLDWLFAEREIFDGRTAVATCHKAEEFRRATILHGLSLGLDVAPYVVEGIPAHEFLSNSARARLFSGPQASDKIQVWPGGRLSLFTCTISYELPNEHVQIFSGMIAHDEREVRTRLRQRYGALLEEEAQVRIGFDWSEPLACAMVSDAMAHVLTIAAADPTSSFARGLDFQVEQRFVA